jgi:DNA invertase Pin-like site-specific DNA recombinase
MGDANVRVVGYIRETPDPNEGEPAFAQGERIRRWVADGGHQLVAVCQDTRIPGHALGREGFKALIGIVERGEANAVVVAELEILSPDKISQEIAVYEIRRRGGRVISTVDDELDLLNPMPQDRIRTIVRDVLEKAARFQDLIDPGGEPEREEVERELIPAGDEGPATEPGVVIELIPPDRPVEDPSAAIRGR